ncbi:hypothetical protein PLO_0576 [Pediococcus acidilactici NGRI 0510Q]|nr:hypothetical protein PLO_0576 [Pediococcus acidilactici NGRI 0510Q]
MKPFAFFKGINLGIWLIKTVQSKIFSIMTKLNHCILDF